MKKLLFVLVFASGALADDTVLNIIQKPMEAITTGAPMISDAIPPPCNGWGWLFCWE